MAVQQHEAELIPELSFFGVNRLFKCKDLSARQ